MSRVRSWSSRECRATVREWQSAVKRWQGIFDSTADQMLTGVTDGRTQEAVINNAMILMHAK